MSGAMNQLSTVPIPTQPRQGRSLSLKSAAVVCLIQPEGVMHPQGMSWAHLPPDRPPGGLQTRASRWTAPLVSLAEKHQVVYVLCGAPPEHFLQWLTPEILPHLHHEFALLQAPEFWGEFRWHFADALHAADSYAQHNAITRWLLLSAQGVDILSASWRARHVSCNPASGLADPATVALLDERMAWARTHLSQVGR